ncbi:hypothetical protein [Sinobacterium norvegicum]|uniref:hypothetical protein n=1 Tax=Sinobacterium norvegicum TaxID=1641715 RepID=UPI001F183965|nr:hypothetical protein [Sinobacterium norvegicum]
MLMISPKSNQDIIALIQHNLHGWQSRYSQPQSLLWINTPLSSKVHQYVCIMQQDFIIDAE